MQCRHDGSDRDLVVRAARGGKDAWDELVDRFAQRVWEVTRGHGLDVDVAATACEATWLGLAARLGDLQDPESVGEWLAAAASDHAMRLVGRCGVAGAWRGPERRRHKRAAATIPVTLSLADDERLFRGQTVDVSLGGMRVRTPEELGIYSGSVLVVIGAGNPIIATRGAVHVEPRRRHCGGDLRIEFAGLCDGRRTSLTRMLDELTLQPSTLS